MPPSASHARVAQRSIASSGSHADSVKVAHRACCTACDSTHRPMRSTLIRSRIAQLTQHKKLLGEQVAISEKLLKELTNQYTPPVSG